MDLKSRLCPQPHIHAHLSHLVLSTPTLSLVIFPPFPCYPLSVFWLDYSEVVKFLSKSTTTSTTHQTNLNPPHTPAPHSLSSPSHFFYFTHSFTHTPHLLPHSLIHSFPHSLIPSFIHRRINSHPNKTKQNKTKQPKTKATQAPLTTS